MALGLIAGLALGKKAAEKKQKREKKKAELREKFASPRSAAGGVGNIADQLGGQSTLGGSVTSTIRRKPR